MIYKCGAGESYIDPSTRYEPAEGWYKNCVLYHSKKYIPLLAEFDISKDIICFDAEMGCTETHRKIVENYFKGSRTFINIGACGAFVPCSASLKLGDVVEPSSILFMAGFSRIFTNRKYINTKCRYGAKKVAVECVPTLYYNKKFIASYVDCAEQESEAVAVTCEWLNYNYGKKYGKCEYYNLFYVSDIVHRSGKAWVDTLKLHEQGDKYRREVLSLILEGGVEHGK